MSSLSKDVRSLSQQQRLLLEQRLQEKRKRSQSEVAISRRKDINRPPLSFEQQRLWFLHQLYPESALYSIPVAFRLSGHLDIVALERTLTTIVARHEILRTTFQFVEDLLVQVISPASRLNLVRIDLRTLEDSAREAQVLQIINQEVLAPFNLKDGPLLRLKLLLIREDEYVFLLSLHHSISDGWSSAVLFEEITALYQAYLRGEPPLLPDLPIQYADYAIWQRQWLSEARMQPLLAYWTSHLENLPVLQLPTDYPPPVLPQHVGGAWYFTLSKELSEQILHLCTQERVTSFIFFLAAFYILLSRYSHQDDIAVGIPVANRPFPELEHLIGFLTNTLVLRISAQRNPSFRQLLAQVREVALSGYSHQEFPFEKLVEALQPQRDLSHNPLFQVMFNLEKQVLGRLHLSDVFIEPCTVQKDTALFDLTLDIVEESIQFVGRLEYNSELFAAPSIERMSRSFLTLLEALVANPNQPILEVPLVSSEDLQLLLVDWNATTTSYPRDLSYAQLFEEQVEKTPDAVALVFRYEHLTYRDLNGRANQLARYLCKQGIGPEVLVGVYMERSPEMIVALLAVLKTGGGYVPLDTTYPRERLQFMLEDTAPPVLLTQQHVMQRQALNAAHILSITSCWEAIQQESSENLAPQASSQNLAYVVYTSGSTGRPKGVMITHRSLINHNLAVIKDCRLHSSDHIFQFYPISFDASVEEIFPALLCGARLILRDNNLLFSSTDLVDLVTSESISFLSLPTAYWHVWVYDLAEADYKLPDCLRLLLVSGEKPLPERLLTWLRLGKASWMNTYGPTEVTVTQTLFEPEADQRRESMLGEIPIGRPIANTQIYLLDSRMQIVPPGVIGEIYIGGEGLARGYLNQPSLTAEAFIPHPFSLQKGLRLYKTGDYGRYLPDGNLQVLSRVDHQIKLHGFRVEPGEIEAVLSRYPGVRQAVALAKEDSQGNKHLVAYVVAEPPITTDQLRSYLKEHLPYYMIPAHLEMLAALPLNSNGKVDKRTLPQLTIMPRHTTAVYVAPHSEIESQVAAIWCSVLSVDKVSIYDNFFDLGGHSLSLVKVHRQVQNIFATRFSLIEMYRHPTVDQLASYLLQTTAPHRPTEEQQKRHELQRKAALRQKQRTKQRRSKPG
ncbi:MAG TPA: amino acid adenylation domain-containing protein [Ktedonobacteraceae bacterium]|nr:amino acid adenylation domain-containing protein [Ktedonobacteraceae bacterium]